MSGGLFLFCISVHLHHFFRFHIINSIIIFVFGLLSMMISRSIHVAANGIISLISVANIPFYIINILKVAVCIYTHPALSYFNIYLLAVLGLCCCSGFLWLQRAGATLHCNVQASHRGGLSCCGAQALEVWSLVVEARRL